MSRLEQRKGEALHEYEKRVSTGMLEQREKTHGAFIDVSTLAQRFKNDLRMGRTYDQLDPRQAEALDLLATKMARIVNGDASHKDHWDDLEGYSKLGGEACEDPNQGKLDV